VIDLGVDRAGRPARIEVEPLTGHSEKGLTLLDVNDRVLLSGDALGAQAPDGGLILNSSLADFAAALKAWRGRTDGKYDVIYTGHNFQWFTLPEFVNQMNTALTKAVEGGEAAWSNSGTMPGHEMIRSPGGPDVVGSIVMGEEKR
jgi:glyoxylase-like metal-dependent hydrolase (beta-lactamase superfamily II)